MVVGPMRLSPMGTWTIQILIVVAVLAAWQLIPAIPGVTELSVVFDRGFVSSPTEVAQAVWTLATGAQDTTPIWPAIRETIQNALVGTVVGIALGMTIGLLLSNDERIDQVLRPLLVASNSIPKIALIPIIVIVVGPNAQTSVVTAALTAFFTVFFNAYEGGRTVAPHVLDNALVMGASPMQTMRDIRLPYVAAWTLANLPNAISHALLAVVVAEVFTGAFGIGRLLEATMSTASASGTFAIVVYLSVAGLVLVFVSDALRRRWLHWWMEGRAA